MKVPYFVCSDYLMAHWCDAVTAAGFSVELRPPEKRVIESVELVLGGAVARSNGTAIRVCTNVTNRPQGQARDPRGRDKVIYLLYVGPASSQGGLGSPKATGISRRELGDAVARILVASGAKIPVASGAKTPELTGCRSIYHCSSMLVNEWPQYIGSSISGVKISMAETMGSHLTASMPQSRWKNGQVRRGLAKVNILTGPGIGKDRPEIVNYIALDHRNPFRWYARSLRCLVEAIQTELTRLGAVPINAEWRREAGVEAAGTD